MEALMFHILTSAQRKTTPQDTPIDLVWRSYTNHTCDRLLALEELRTQQNSYITDEDDHIADRGVNTTPVTSPDYSTKAVKKETPHPFSIAALIGETGSDDESPSAPAFVYSPYMDNSTRYQNFILGFILGMYGQTSMTHSVSDLSPIRGISMLKTKNVYWCHVCCSRCKDKNEADLHQFTHRVRGDQCNTGRAILKAHGYVTCHEILDNDRMKCGLCDKVVTVCFFHKHQRLHEGHFCKVCGQEFATNSRLKDHMNLHTGKTPFSCTTCDRKFAKRSSLTQHQRYHRDHKGFMCRFCQKSFNSKYTCTVHERLHTGDNPFKCQYPGCSRAFPQKIQLKLHINTHHTN